jgi:hypothetical protein
VHLGRAPHPFGELHSRGAGVFQSGGVVVRLVTMGSLSNLESLG